MSSVRRSDGCRTSIGWSRSPIATTWTCSGERGPTPTTGVSSMSAVVGILGRFHDEGLSHEQGSGKPSSVSGPTLAR